MLIISEKDIPAVITEIIEKEFLRKTITGLWLITEVKGRILIKAVEIILIRIEVTDHRVQLTGG